ncbi:MAG: hypothetical protein K2X68_06315 [Novosphingobium sp.]|nr:hypothetical protein [Novosphingobium sp.]
MAAARAADFGDSAAARAATASVMAVAEAADADAARAAAAAAAMAASNAARISGSASTSKTVWTSITRDANWYEAHGNGSAGNLASQPLWLGKAPAWFAKTNEEAEEVWRADLAAWSVWAEWYSAHVKGREQNWPLPDAQDRAMNEWLFSQTDEWWKRDDVRAINTEIAEKLAELSQVDEKAMLESVLADLAAGKEPDLSSPMAQAALVELLAAIRKFRNEIDEQRAMGPIASDASEPLNPRAVIGGNRPPVDMDDPEITSVKAAIALGETALAQNELVARIDALEAALTNGQVQQLINQANWFHRFLRWLPDGFKEKFSETLGEKSAEALVDGSKTLAKWMFHLSVTLPSLLYAVHRLLELIRFH